MASEKTFHPFPRLPKELRDMIWDFAIRPARPSVHFFSIYNPYKDSELAAMEEHTVVVRGRTCGWAAPRGEGSSYSWTASNPSVYLIDGGLWTACTESRERMEKHFRYQELRRELSEFCGSWWERPDAPATGALLRNGEEQAFTVYPRTDLLCLQPFDPETLCWDDSLGKKVPFFNKNNDSYYPDHLALELDPLWWEDVDAPGMMSLAIDMCQNILESPLYLWFIDRRLRWNGDGPVDISEGRHVFHGNGCRYIEVRLREYWTYDTGHTHQWDTGAFDFINELEHSLLELESQSLPLSDHSYPEGMPQFGVLACLPDDWHF